MRRTPLVLTALLLGGVAVPAAAEPTVTKVDAALGDDVTAVFWARDGKSFYAAKPGALVQVDPATGETTELAAEALPRGPLPPRALSKQGDRLVFADGAELVVLDLGTGKATRQEVDAWGLAIHEPQWAADDRTVIGWAMDEHGGGTLVTATPATGDSGPVRCKKLDHISFARLTGDGKKVVVVNDGDVYVADLRCKKPRKTKFAGWAKRVDGSPDGKAIAVERDAGAGAGLRVQVGKLTGKPAEASRKDMLAGGTFVSNDAVLVHDLGPLGMYDVEQNVPKLYSVKQKRTTRVPVTDGCEAWVAAAAPAHGKALLAIACGDGHRSYAVLTP